MMLPPEPVALLKLTEKVSLPSIAVSPLMVTLKVLLVLPAAITWPASAMAT